MSALLAIFMRDLSLAFRIGGGFGLAVGFFALFVALLPLGIGRDLPTLAAIGPGILWLGAALSTLLSLDRLYQADVEDGSLDHMLLADLPLEAITLAKVAAQWMTTGLPLIIAAPVLGVLLNLDGGTTIKLTLSLLIGTPALSLIGSIAAAMTAGLKRGGLLVSLLSLPLFVPVLIFGAAMASAQTLGAAALFLGAASLLALAVSPFASAAALRLHVS